MTSNQRRQLRKRKERNQTLWLWGQDLIGAACLFGTLYLLTFIPLLFK